MKRFFKSALLLICIIAITSCSSSYKAIKPPLQSYSSNDMKNGVAFSYKYDVLQQQGNRKYAKKEDKKDIKVIAVRFENTSESIVTFGQDFEIYSGNNPVKLLEPLVLKNELKQSTPVYLLYLLLTPLKLTVTTQSSMDVYPIGFVLGPLFTVGNMLGAGSANKDFLIELNQYNLFNRDIQPGEVVYGIIGIRSGDYNALTIVMN